MTVRHAFNPSIVRGRLLKLAVVVFTGLLVAGSSEPASRAPLTAKTADTAEHRRLNKTVLESRLLDDMETLESWSLTGQGEMALTGDRSRTGAHSLRIRYRTRTPEDQLDPASDSREFGRLVVRRRFSGEDWRKFNRISVWIHPDLPGWNVASLDMRFQGEPQSASRESWNSLTLANHTWNHVVWEIAHLARNNVTGIEFHCRRQGNEPGASGTVTFDIDRLELQRVEPDYYEGWHVAPGRIAYSHSGYDAGARKTGMASDQTLQRFRVVREDTGQVVLEKPCTDIRTALGRFKVMDFSELREPGAYRLQAGALRTQPFRIADNVWTESIAKVMNYFYVQRCGEEIPGVHRPCHRDWIVRHGGKSILINGGWHDAGDLSQVTACTAEAVYAMLETVERLRARQEDPALQRQVLEEARVGLDWLLKTSFGDGYRVLWSCMNIWTDGILGNNDDIAANATNLPFENFLAASAEAKAARVFRETDPRLAADSLARAVEDWRFAVEGLARPLAGIPLVPGTWIPETLIFSTGIQASLDLYKATGEAAYSRKALELAGPVLAAQQRTVLAPGELPVTGFFYETQRKERILHYFHRAHDQAPIAALAGLCDAFPDHPDWMKWYGAVALYSEYLRRGASFSAPFHMLPSSIYRDDEDPVWEPDSKEDYRRQIQHGIPVAPGYRLRLFPAWIPGARGNNGVLLSEAKAIAIAARLRGSLTLADLGQHQMEWEVGRNPFSQSVMYGEGHDYSAHYSAMCGQIVGSIPAGIETNGDEDVPYWPDATFPTFKEHWSHTALRWLSLAGDISGSAVVTGRAAGSVAFRHTGNSRLIVAWPDRDSGRFRARLPQSEYTVEARGQRTSLAVLPGGAYEIDLRPGRGLDFHLEYESNGDGQITVKAIASGVGRHRLSIRADNLDVAEAEKSLDLTRQSRQIISWQGRIRSKDAICVIVVFPDGDLSKRKDLLTGLGDRSDKRFGSVGQTKGVLGTSRPRDTGK